MITPDNSRPPLYIWGYAKRKGTRPARLCTSFFASLWVSNSLSRLACLPTRPLHCTHRICAPESRMKPLLIALLFACTFFAPSQSHAQQTGSVLMLSDIHLDPFHDPAKFPELRAAPIAEWAAILSSPPSTTQVADFTKLQSTCGARGIDTPAALLEASLRAAHTQQPRPLFVTVSGDLIAHQFDCRFHTLAHTGSAADNSAFAARTVAFVALRLRETFPGTPIYLALGNNDSGCHDYQEDPNSAFLHADGLAFAADAITPANAAAIQRDFSEYGDYTIALPIPHTRLIVLQDILESSRYTTCDGKPSTDASSAQITWFRHQLDLARAAHQRVWVMAHIPPGIDAYTTIKRGRGSSCNSGAPELFIPSNALASTLSQYADIIKLALFGHTHMDEIRSYTSDSTHATVPGKLVPSISPVNGNNPAFTIAEIDPATATLTDYTVYSSTKPATWDIAPIWSEEYRYSTTYHLPDFSGASTASLTAALLADKAGDTPAAQAYQQFYFVGEPDAVKGMKAAMRAAAMRLVWPVYACSLANADTTSFAACVCPAPAPAPAAHPLD
jgi:sphingomyelin phosphodiesterase acid-like 3